MNETKLLKRIAADPAIFGSKPLIRSRRLAVGHVFGMLAAPPGILPMSYLVAIPDWSRRISRLAFSMPRESSDANE